MERCLLQECDLCHNEYPIHKGFHDNEPKIWIEYNDKQFLCNKCRGDINIKDITDIKNTN